MEPEISSFEVDSSQSDTQTDSDTERSYADMIGLKIERRSDGGSVVSDPSNRNSDCEIGFNNVPPLDFLETQKALGVEGPVQILADVSCQTVDDTNESSTSPSFLEMETPLETMTEFHDTHQTVYITQNPEEDDEEGKKKG